MTSSSNNCAFDKLPHSISVLLFCVPILTKTRKSNKKLWTSRSVCERESMLQSSGTRFGEILFVFANFLRAYLVASKNFEPTLANLVCYWAKFHRRKWPNSENIIISSHWRREREGQSHWLPWHFSQLEGKDIGHGHLPHPLLLLLLKRFQAILQEDRKKKRA